MYAHTVKVEGVVNCTTHRARKGKWESRRRGIQHTFHSYPVASSLWHRWRFFYMACPWTMYTILYKKKRFSMLVTTSSPWASLTCFHGGLNAAIRKCD